MLELALLGYSATTQGLAQPDGIAYNGKAYQISKASNPFLILYIDKSIIVFISCHS
jgi:hypothetical protein